MSRLDGRWAAVECDEQGQPCGFTPAGAQALITITGIRSHWREWLGGLEGEPERDVWQVQTPQGTCELHALRVPVEDGGKTETAPARWVLFRWED